MQRANEVGVGFLKWGRARGKLVYKETIVGDALVLVLLCLIIVAPMLNKR